MTVEQEESRGIVKTKTVRLPSAISEREQSYICQIQEVTGIQSTTVIREAVKQCTTGDGKFDVAEVISLLLPEHNKDSQVVPTTVDASCSSDTSTQQTVYGPPNKDGVIDLTNESSEQDDLMKAIAASLQDSQGILGSQVVSKEDIEVSRILEASLADSKTGTKRRHGDLWFRDPVNPHERMRETGWPVGLKNVGNTCWFSAVIQSLFHIPSFRTMVLNYRCPETREPQSASDKQKHMFMKELRELFGYMLATTRKYVDPFKAVEILKEAFVSSGSVADAQQDVSEFQHKLLDWLEEAFEPPGCSTGQSQVAAPSHGSKTHKEPTHSRPKKVTFSQPAVNPVKQMFYGQVKTEGFNEGNMFSNVQSFGQFPLQVVNYKDIHESLEATTARGKIEALREGLPASGQEQWFTRLPPVLTFELSRFLFNQHLSRPEKVHNRLTFPCLLYMDRYLEENKELTRGKREQVKDWKDQLTCLFSRLDRFMNYGSGAKKFPLQHILQYALDFAESSSAEANEAEMRSPNSQHSMRDTPTSSPSSSTHIPDVAMTTPNKEEVADVVRHTAVSSPSIAEHSQPVPCHVTSAEQAVLKDCLQRWRLEVEASVKDLQAEISRLEEIINAMYSEEELKKHGYRLHAVLVHEGQAASGHYWSYIYDSEHNRWLKYNDISVTEASWEELKREGAGGHHNTSAYCLMYINQALSSQLFSIPDVPTDVSGDKSSKDAQFTAQNLARLPVDLQKIVMADNERLVLEIKNWDSQHRDKTSQDVSVVHQQEPAQGSSGHQAAQKVSLSLLHSQLALAQTKKVMQAAVNSDAFKSGKVEKAVVDVTQAELQRLINLSTSVEKCLPYEDPRLLHIVVYIMYINPDCCRTQALVRVLLDHFALLGHTHGHDSNSSAFVKIVKVKLEETLKLQSQDDLRLYKVWHENYSRFRKATHLFLHALSLFHDKKYQEALPNFLHACIINQTLVRESTKRGLHQHLLAYFRRQCVLHLNEHAASKFENGKEVGETLSMMSEVVLPCLVQLIKSGSPEDESTVDEIRQKWCSFLAQDLQSVQQEKLQDFLSKLLDIPSDVRIKMPAVQNLPEPANMPETYKMRLALANEHGYEVERLES